MTSAGSKSNEAHDSSLFSSQISVHGLRLECAPSELEFALELERKQAGIGVGIRARTRTQTETKTRTRVQASPRLRRLIGSILVAGEPAEFEFELGLEFGFELGLELELESEFRFSRMCARHATSGRTRALLRRRSLLFRRRFFGDNSASLRTRVAANKSRVISLIRSRRV